MFTLDLFLYIITLYCTRCERMKALLLLLLMPGALLANVLNVSGRS